MLKGDDAKRYQVRGEAGSVMTGWCMETMNIVRDTAHRDLVDLVKRGILIRRGLGRGAAYLMKEGTIDDEIIRFLAKIIRCMGLTRII